MGKIGFRIRYSLEKNWYRQLVKGFRLVIEVFRIEVARIIS